MKIYGRNAVMEALKSGNAVNRLAVMKGLKTESAQTLIDLAKERGVKINFLDKEAMDFEGGDIKHQGFIADVADYKYSELEDIVASSEKPFILILDGIEDPHNLGSILRVAECAGVHGVVIPKHRSAAVNETVIKVSAGAASHVKVARVTNVNDAIEYCKKNGMWVYCAETGGEEIYKTNLTGAIALVIGGEDSGVGSRTKSNCDGVVSIPMFGKVNSLNAAAACSVAVYEKIRQDRGVK